MLCLRSVEGDLRRYVNSAGVLARIVETLLIRRLYHRRRAGGQFGLGSASKVAYLESVQKLPPDSEARPCEKAGLLERRFRNSLFRAFLVKNVTMFE